MIVVVVVGGGGGGGGESRIESSPKIALRT